MSAVSEGFVAVGKTCELAPGEMKFVAVDRERVVLANVEGALYALRDMCGHRNAPLSRGKLIGCLIECPLHFAQFDVRTGELVDGPMSANVPVYQVRVDGDTVYVNASLQPSALRAVSLDCLGVGRVGAHIDPALPAPLQRVDDI